MVGGAVVVLVMTVVTDGGADLPGLAVEQQVRGTATAARLHAYEPAFSVTSKSSSLDTAPMPATRFAALLLGQPPEQRSIVLCTCTQLVVG